LPAGANLKQIVEGRYNLLIVHF